MATDPVVNWFHDLPVGGGRPTAAPVAVRRVEWMREAPRLHAVPAPTRSRPQRRRRSRVAVRLVAAGYGVAVFAAAFTAGCLLVLAAQGLVAVADLIVAVSR